MNIEQIRDYCLSFKGVTEELPFGPDNLVFKVLGKMFILLPLETENLKFNFKNKPEINIELRAQYPNIVGAFHMNKTHWNTITVGYEFKPDMVLNLISESYHCVVEGFTKAKKIELESINY